AVGVLVEAADHLGVARDLVGARGVRAELRQLDHARRGGPAEGAALATFPAQADQDGAVTRDVEAPAQQGGATRLAGQAAEVDPAGRRGPAARDLHGADVARA